MRSRPKPEGTFPLRKARMAVLNRPWVGFSAVLILALLIALSGCRTRAGEDAVPIGSVLTPRHADTARLLALYSEGIARSVHDDIDGAIESYSRAIQIDPHSQRLFESLANCYIANGMVAEGIAKFELLEESHPDSWPLQRWMALLLQLGDRNDAAESRYLRAIELDPSAREPYIELAALYIGDDRRQDAVLLLEKAAELLDNPDEVSALLAGIHSRIASETSDKAVADKHRYKAINALEDITVADNGDVRRQLALVQLYALNLHFDKAFETAAKILEKQTDDQTTRPLLIGTLVGICRSRSDDLMNALGGLETEYGDDGEMLAFIADILTGIGEIEPALRMYRQSMETGSAMESTYLRAALLDMSLEGQSALEILAAGLSRYPDSPELLSARARLRMESGDYRGAVDDFEKAFHRLEIDEERSPAPLFYIQYAIALQIADQADRAAEVLNRPELLDEKFLQVYFTMATALMDAGDRRSIFNVLKELKDAAPENPAVRAYMGHYRNMVEEHGQAVLHFREALALAEARESYADNLLATYHFWLGGALERSGELERAADAFRSCVGLAPDFAEAYNYMAYMWAEAGINLEEARDMIAKALELEPANGAFIDTLGWIDYQQGRYGEAVSNLERAQALVPDDPTVSDHLGDAHWKLGETDKAIEYWRRALTLDSENEAITAKIDRANKSK